MAHILVFATYVVLVFDKMLKNLFDLFDKMLKKLFDLFDLFEQMVRYNVLKIVYIDDEK